MKVLGISCGHDANVCIVDEEGIRIHLEKERFTRKKHDPGAVDDLIIIALKSLGWTIDDIDLVASSIPVWPEYGRSGRIVSGEVYKSLFEYSEHTFELLGRQLPAVFIPHHVGHMAYAYYLSGFDDADIISVDAYGNFTATAIGVGEGLHLAVLYNLYPSNIGALWCIVSKRIFGNLLDAGKTMGLAPYGEPRYLNDLRSRYLKWRDGFPLMDDPWVDNGDVPILNQLGDLFDPLHPISRDMAASVQAFTNEIMLDYARITKQRSGKATLCLTGGVALNGIANNLITKSGLYDSVFIGPATNDGGLSIGFALYALHNIRKEARPSYNKHVFLSKPYAVPDYKEALICFADQIIVEELPKSELIEAAADLLVKGEILAWYQGRAESGPRALGHRCILCNPIVEGMKDTLNHRVKHRESFRPFAPSILIEKKAEYFELDTSSPYMLRVVNVLPQHHDTIPAVVHVDGSSRPQTVDRQTENALYYDLIHEFGRKSGTPVLLNTSFNIRGEPIVENPVDALKSFLATELNYLILHNWLIRKKPS